MNPADGSWKKTEECEGAQDNDDCEDHQGWRKERRCKWTIKLDEVGGERQQFYGQRYLERGSWSDPKPMPDGSVTCLKGGDMNFRCSACKYGEKVVSGLCCENGTNYVAHGYLDSTSGKFV